MLIPGPQLKNKDENSVVIKIFLRFKLAPVNNAFANKLNNTQFSRAMQKCRRLDLALHLYLEALYL